MRPFLLASLVSLVGGSAFGQSLLGQSQPGGGPSSVIVVPNAPKIVAAPASVAAVPLVKPAPPPPGLVETPLPPPNMVRSSSAASEAASTTQPMPGEGPRSLVPPGPAPQIVAQPVMSPPAQPVPAPATLSPPVPAVAPPAAGITASGSIPPVAAATSVSGVPAASGSGSGVSAPSVAAVSAPASDASAKMLTPAGDVAPVPDQKWVYGHVAELGVLNKVDGSTKILTIPVGGQATSGDLSVSVQACVVRPPGALPNAAVFLTLQSADPTAMPTPIYRGWMVKSMPGAGDVENADEAFRIISCS